MSVKSNLLHILEQYKGSCVSGQDLAEISGVSRAAVWKAIKSLMEEGYEIEASKKGYTLSPSSDILSAQGIRLYLNEEFKDIPIRVYKTIGSTNTEAKLLSVNNAGHGTTIVAEEQTQGRGRFGRDFFSPSDSGIYMSIILKPQLSMENAVLITTAAAVAVSQAIEKTTGLSPWIKWVNDIFIDDRKVCGILTEAVTNFESGMMDSVVVGIGINVKTKKDDFPPELQDIAGSLFNNKDKPLRNRLAGEIINNLLNIGKNLEDRSFMKAYKQRSMVLGHHILYKKDNLWQEAYALDIDDYGGLIVQRPDGQKITLNSGEVSIKKK
ncbi:MAG: biotin--[acetyl-CoA-carboxylase] ligase [Caldicoprobacterales bacterium]|jgi:BirA family biotin operon repressor/biotin-[acetyl-CoA-carboxylase] ligase